MNKTNWLNVDLGYTRDEIEKNQTQQQQQQHTRQTGMRTSINEMKWMRKKNYANAVKHFSKGRNIKTMTYCFVLWHEYAAHAHDSKRHLWFTCNPSVSIWNNVRNFTFWIFSLVCFSWFTWNHWLLTCLSCARTYRNYRQATGDNLWDHFNIL